MDLKDGGNGRTWSDGSCGKLLVAVGAVAMLGLVDGS